MKKFFYLTCLIYLFIYILPFPFVGVFEHVLDPFLFSVGKNILGIATISNDFTNSGDRMYDYVKLLVLVFIAIMFAGVAMLLTKQVKFEIIRNNTFIYATYYVGLMMINYGIAKLFDCQFAIPSYDKLESTFGDSSPMGLMWAFMGASKPYYIFAAILQVLSGTLVLFKRTKTLGALLTFIFMLNVVVMNLCYDVPAKILSGHLLILSVIIIAPELKSIYSFFILRVPVQLAPIQKREGKYPKIRTVLSAIFIVGFTYKSLGTYISYSFKEGSYSGRGWMDGTYKTDLFIIESDTMNADESNVMQWKSLIMSRDYAKVIKATDSSEVFKLSIDSTNKTITFKQRDEGGTSYKLDYQNKNGKLQLNGLWKDKKITAVFSVKTHKDYLLTNRGFHWVNETIFNR